MVLSGSVFGLISRYAQGSEVLAQRGAHELADVDNVHDDRSSELERGDRGGVLKYFAAGGGHIQRESQFGGEHHPEGGKEAGSTSAPWWTGSGWQRWRGT